jgi:arabinogalactan oligomer/maltooligosaccharide transport system permease protein
MFIQLLILYLLVVSLFVHQSTINEYARRKGYEGVKVGLISLVPILSYFYYKKLPKKRNVSNQGLKDVFRWNHMIQRIMLYLQIIFVAIIVIVPVIYIFGLAFSNIRSDIPNQIWPANPNFDAFIYLFRETKFTTWYWNTLSIALINMLLGTVLITGAAYVFARFSFKGKKAGLLGILVLQAFPSFMGLIAMYVLFWKFGLLGQPRALSILYIGGSIPGNLWLIKGFLQQIPKELDESAMIDGANKFQIFWHIILPLAVPILTFVAVTMFMAPWMDYILPGYLLNYYPTNAPLGYDITNQWTLAVGLFRFITDLEYLHYSAFAAGALLVGIPITILYMVFQRYIIEGIMAGATKG